MVFVFLHLLIHPENFLDSIHDAFIRKIREAFELFKDMLYEA